MKAYGIAQIVTFNVSGFTRFLEIEAIHLRQERIGQSFGKQRIPGFHTQRDDVEANPHAAGNGRLEPRENRGTPEALVRTLDVPDYFERPWRSIV